MKQSNSNSPQAVVAGCLSPADNVRYCRRNSQRGNSPGPRFHLFAFATLGATLVTLALGQSNPGTDQLPIKPPPVATGVVPLPQGPPSTASQGPLPSPISKLPPADHPLILSPDPKVLQGWVEGRPLTIDDAVAIALYTSRPFVTSVATLLQEEARTGEAKSQLSPRIGLNGNLQYFDKATTATFGAAGSPPIVLNPQFNPVYSAAISLPIDIAGTLRSAVSQAQFAEVAAEIDVNRVRNQVAFDVKNAFYNVLRAQAQAAVATENVNNSLERLSFANKNYAAGTNSRFDVLTAQRDVADSQQSLIAAKSAVSIDLAALKNVIGIDIKSRIRITGQGAVQVPPVPDPTTAIPPIGAGNALKPVATETAKSDAQRLGTSFSPLAMPPTDTVDDNFDFGPEYDALLAEGLAKRPEVLESQAQVKAAEAGLQYARRSALPTVDLSVSHVYTPNATAFTRVDQYVATLGVSIPLFDGGLARERTKETRAQRALAEISRRQAVDQVKLEIQSAYISLVQARQRVAVTNVEVIQAQETLRVGRLRYTSGVSQQVGVSPQIELSNSQVSLTQALTNQVNALYDYNSAHAQLDRALGRYAFVGSGPGYSSPPPMTNEPDYKANSRATGS